MKIVFLKVIDPICWRKPESAFYDDNLEELSIITVDRVAGILLYETDDTIVIGETSVAKDNPKLVKYNWSFPRHRYVSTIWKKNIIERQEFEIEEKTNA